LVSALYFLGQGEQARVASEGLLAAAAATSNPYTACFALFSHGFAYRDVDPVASYDAQRRALTIAQDSGNRQMEAAIAVTLSMGAATHDDPTDSLDYLSIAIRHYYDAGSISLMHNPLAILTCVFDQLGRHEQAATISGFAATPMGRAGYPQINATIVHLREILGDKLYGSLARAGEAMTVAAMGRYALDEIDDARAELKAVSK
jgi:hypothetical protein